MWMWLTRLASDWAVNTRGSGRGWGGEAAYFYILT